MEESKNCWIWLQLQAKIKTKNFISYHYLENNLSLAPTSNQPTKAKNSQIDVKWYFNILFQLEKTNYTQITQS